jgi:hypothetical protein
MRYDGELPGCAELLTGVEGVSSGAANCAALRKPSKKIMA